MFRFNKLNVFRFNIRNKFGAFSTWSRNMNGIELLESVNYIAFHYVKWYILNGCTFMFVISYKLLHNNKWCDVKYPKISDTFYLHLASGNLCTTFG